MSGFFLTVVNMSISASWTLLAVLLLRILFTKTPKWITVLLWGVVAVRLICPFSIESAISLIPSAETISYEIMMDKTPTVNSGFPVINNFINPVINESFAPNPSNSINPLQILIPVLSIVFIAGIALMLGFTVISYLRVKIKLGTAVLLRDNIFQSENVASPFVLGIIKPKIYLPFNINEKDIGHVIAHEKAHIRRKDYLWKPLGFLILTLHWFNPLMWLGYVLLCRDIELACDEKVIKDFDNEQKADYSQALLTCSVNRRMISVCPLAFGEVGVKDRVKSVVKYKKPAFWIVAVAVALSIVFAICFLTNPAHNKIKNIENMLLSQTVEETVNVMYSNDGHTYSALNGFSKDYLKELVDINISNREISKNRSEDREGKYIIVLRTEKDTEPTIYSHIKGVCICFNSDFSEVWVNDGVKPTLSYKVINPKKAKGIYEKIADYDYYSAKFFWAYSPMLSYTGHYAKAFLFDLDYTHIEATCTYGEMWNLDAKGQPKAKTLQFEKGQCVYWSPEEAVAEKIPKISKVEFSVYDGNNKIYSSTVIFECISRVLSSAEFEIYIEKSNGLFLVQKDGAMCFVEKKNSSVSNIGGVDATDVKIF
ncbi:MAG: M56 family metallopeptidase [Ruminococcaceae bacterium]|nr:M56 family metallopeptidase [Oscillospiraceae bacterium]